jgi:flavin reductase (DIM6/NTAB) family NADH-FMN oxidoreductase RutF
VLLDFLERRAPLTVPEYRAGCDARTLRDALGCFATGVTVVTAMTPEGTPIGLTANSFTSVSLDPPLLLVCIARSAGSVAALEAAMYFAVNVLQIGQQPASVRFAGRGQDRFAATAWERGQCGPPVLTGSLSTFECERHAIHEGGDHLILVGRVVRATFDPRRDPLLYFRGKYRRLHFA